MKRRAAILALIFISFGHIPGYTEGIENKVTYSLNSYLDNNRGLIVTNKLGIVKALKEKFAMGGNIGVDAITAASPSNKDIKDKTEKSKSYRNYASLSGIYDDRENSATVGAYMSSETDYTGSSLFVNYVRQLNNQNTSLGFVFSTLSDKWKLDKLPRNDRKGTQVDLSITQFLSPTAQLQLGYSNIVSRGYLASPYRFIEQTAPATAIEESLPSSRKGDTYSLRLVKQLNMPASLNLSYRYYSDDWKITSHTINTELYRDLSDKLTIGGRLRYYSQSDTAYTKPIGSYTGSEKYVAVDYKYSAFDSYMAGVNMIYNLESGNTLKGSLDFYKTSDNDFIKFWYGRGSINATIFSFSYDYLY